MKLNSQKELTPVIYGELAVKMLEFEVEKDEECFPLHWHDRIELLRINEGSLNVTIDSEEMQVCEDEVCVFYPTQPHSGIAGKSGASYDVIMFDIADFYNSTAAGKMYLEPIAEQKMRFVNITDKKQIVAAIDKIKELYLSKQKGSSLQIMGQVYMLLGLMYSYFEETKSIIYSKNDNFAAVVDYVNENFKSPITIGELSRKFGYNEAYFSRTFKKATGITAVKYINILRLEYAQKQLKNTDNMIAQIAYSSGFSDVYHFTHSFKLHFGISPSEYRKKNRSLL